jgi:hypothetical protein
MHRTATALGIAAALGFAVSLGAQTPTSTTPSQSSMSSKEVNVTGCLARGSDGKFTLTNARIEPASSSTTAGTTGTAGATTTAGATSPAGSGSAASAMTWALSGGTDLDKHVGHKITVTGRTSWDATKSGSATSAPSPTTTTAGATTTADSKGPELDVQSVKMIAASCS